MSDATPGRRPGRRSARRSPCPGRAPYRRRREWPARRARGPRGRRAAGSPQSRMWLPLSLMNGSPSTVRSAGSQPRVRNWRTHQAVANGITSTGNLPRLPSTGTSFSLPTRMISWRDAAATTFSRTSAPPYPLIRLRCGSTSSAPSTVTSMLSTSPRPTSGIPNSRPSSVAACEVGTPCTRRPWRTRVPRARMKAAAARPVPSPTVPPAGTKSRARLAMRSSVGSICDMRPSMVCAAPLRRRS